VPTKDFVLYVRDTMV
jgi:hypothetical protein